MIDYFIGGGVIGAMILIVITQIRKRKGQVKGSCSCCSGCPNADRCN